MIFVFYFSLRSNDLKEILNFYFNVRIKLGSYQYEF